MIINGGARTNSGWFANHLTDEKNNGRVSYLDFDGVAADDVKGAFKEMAAVARGSRVHNWFYHANINPQNNESLTPEQWKIAVEELTNKLGLTDHSRFVVEHEKNGRTHRHVIWSRLNPDTLHAVSDSMNYVKHEEVSRALEREFGLTVTHGAFTRGPDGKRPNRRLDNTEVFRGKRSGIDPYLVKAELTEFWNKAETGSAFMSLASDAGYMLARGSKGVFCAIDGYGDTHSLARRIDGAKKADITAKMKDVDFKTLPTVEEARQAQKERAVERRANTYEDLKRQQEEIETSKKQAITEEEERGHYSENVVRDQDQLRTLDEQDKQRAKHRDENEKLAEKARGTETVGEGRSGEDGGEIRSAEYRYAQALGKHYSIKDPYGSLAKSSMDEYRMFLADREALKSQLAKEDDPSKKRMIELRMGIESNEYLAKTSNRIATQSEIIVGKNNTEEAVKQRGRASALTEEAKAMREEYASLSKAGKDGAKAENVPPPEKSKHFVVDEKTGSRTNLSEHLKTARNKDFSETFPKDQDDIYSSKQALTEYKAWLGDNRSRSKSINNISKSLAGNKDINADDIKKLSKSDVDQIREKGDAALADIVKNRQKHIEPEKSKSKSAGLDL